MRHGPPNSVVDYDYFLDIWTAVTFLISLPIRDPLMTHRGPRTQSREPWRLSRISPYFSITRTLPTKQMKQKMSQRIKRSPEDALSRNKNNNNFIYLQSIWSSPGLFQSWPCNIQCICFIDDHKANKADLFCPKPLLLFPPVFNQAECKITSWLCNFIGTSPRSSLRVLKLKYIAWRVD